jgi:hypothetical protein
VPVNGQIDMEFNRCRAGMETLKREQFGLVVQGDADEE